MTYALTTAYLATFLLAIGTIGNLHHRRVGGIHFLALGRLRVSYCVAREARS